MPAVYQQELHALMAAVSAVLPSYETIRSRLYRTRQAAVSARRRPGPRPAGGSGDSAATCGGTSADGAATYAEVPPQVASVGELHSGDVVEVAEESAETEDADDLEDARSDVESDPDGVRPGTGDGALCDRTFDPSDPAATSDRQGSVLTPDVRPVGPRGHIRPSGVSTDRTGTSPRAQA